MVSKYSVILLVIAFAIQKYFQYKSLKYLHKEYENLKHSYFTFHVFYPPDEYYENIKGPRLRNIGASIGLTLGFIAILCALFL